MEWLTASIDASRPHEVGLVVSWHGRIMVLAWGVIAPLAVLIARYFKVLPGQDWPRELDRQFWWQSHLYGQISAVVLTLFGAALVLLTDGPAAGLHRSFGLAMVALALAQGVLGFLRGSKGGPTAPGPDGSLSGDHYDMTPWRLMFEALHKSSGYIAIVLGAATVVQGMWLANAPRWMWLVVGGWWVMLLAIGITLQIRGHAIDTYQAIWGPDPMHPGNRRPPQGWGMRRIEDHSPEGER